VQFKHLGELKLLLFSALEKFLVELDSFLFAKLAKPGWIGWVVKTIQSRFGSLWIRAEPHRSRMMRSGNQE